MLIGTIVLGNLKFHKNKDNLAKEVSAAYQQDLKESEQKEKDKVSIIKKEKNDSLIAWMKYLSLEKDTISISMLGSSVTAGAGTSSEEKKWTNSLVKYINSQDDISNVKQLNNGYGGYTTSGLIKENKIKELIKEKPDLVLFEMCLINNHAQNVTIKETKDDIKSITEEIKKSLPDTLIIFQTANAIENNNQNDLGLTYEDYNTTISEYILNQNWTLFDTFKDYSDIVNNDNLVYKDYLSDEVHPNDNGYKIWFNILKDHVNKVKID